MKIIGKSPYPDHVITDCHYNARPFYVLANLFDGGWLRQTNVTMCVM